MTKVKDLYNSVTKYQNLKQKFLKADSFKVNNKKIKYNPKNKSYANEWLLKKEEKLKAQNPLNEVSEIRNSKTLYKEIMMLNNVLYWFNDYDLKEITGKEIKEISDGIEKGTINTKTGKRLSNSGKKDYFTKVFRGDNTFFNYLGKEKFAQDVIERKYEEKREVRFFDYDTFRIIEKNAVLNTHKLAFWLLYDTGIEISAICQLTKSDFIKQYNEKTKQEYYKVIVGKDISKKTRQKRYLDILYRETNELLKTQLEKIKDDERVFKFSPAGLYKALKLIVKQYNLKTQGETAKEITIKDFRSSCAIRVLNVFKDPYKVNVRLGHKISSREIDTYINFLGLDTEKDREEIQKLDYKDLEDKFKESQSITLEQQKDIQNLKNELEKIRTENEGFRIMTQIVLKGFTAEEFDKISNEQRAKKGLPSLEEEYQQNKREMEELKKKGELDPVIEKEYDKLNREIEERGKKI